MKMKELTIEYLDGTSEKLIVDDVYYGSKDECLRYSILFGVNSGDYYVPLVQIKRWIVR